MQVVVLAQLTVYSDDHLLSDLAVLRDDALTVQIDIEVLVRRQYPTRQLLVHPVYRVGLYELLHHLPRDLHQHSGRIDHLGILCRRHFVDQHLVIIDVGGEQLSDEVGVVALEIEVLHKVVEHHFAIDRHAYVS